MARFDRRSGVAALLVAAIGCAFLPAREAAAQAGDAVDGAVWRFSLDRIGRGPGPDKLRGSCRVSNYEMFQREVESSEKPADSNPRDWQRKVGGVEKSKRKKTGPTDVVWTITDLIVFDQNRRQHTLDGRITAEVVKGGEWKGLFVDGDGRRWDFSVQRIQE